MHKLHLVSQNNAVESSRTKTEAARTTRLCGTGKQPLNAFPRNKRDGKKGQCNCSTVCCRLLNLST